MSTAVGPLSAALALHVRCGTSIVDPALTEHHRQHNPSLACCPVLLDGSPTVRLDPLLEDTLAALVATTILGTALALFYWLMTGLSPWPFVIIGEIGGFGFGVAVLALSSPRRH
jgi:hypothetical protein